jgi:hypothetical protein
MGMRNKKSLCFSRKALSVDTIDCKILRVIVYHFRILLTAKHFALLCLQTVFNKFVISKDFVVLNRIRFCVTLLSHMMFSSI